jgi:pimeloyl-ACP methyl ester carboxylesterase
VAEQLIEVNGVELCTESFGDRVNPPILLNAGISSSMIWWEDNFCRMLADGGRFVIRYDQRDTGRSVTYEVGHPGYTDGDMLADAVGVLDAYDVPAAHLVGVSAGGAFAQLLALDYPDRVLSLVLISTSFAVSSQRTLPSATQEFKEFVATARIDWSDADSVIDYLVDYWRVLAGTERSFDEPSFRELVRRDVERARNFAATQNHEIIPEDKRTRGPLSSITAPTLVIHGTADPMFPLAHGQTLAEEIPGATFLPLEGAGHGVYRADWQTIVHAIIEHTAKIDPSRR